MIEKMIEKVKENLIETILDAYAPKSVTEIIIPLKIVSELTFSLEIM